MMVHNMTRESKKLKIHLCVFDQMQYVFMDLETYEETRLEKVGTISIWPSAVCLTCCGCVDVGLDHGCAF